MAFTNLPPNLKDMFYNLSDRISKLETGPNQAMYTAVVANEEASQAIEEATQALIQAQAAYAIGAQSLIKSADTITNAQNQITGINGNGITVYSGSSSTSGPRVVLNSAGLAGFTTPSSGNPTGVTFAIDASNGAVSTNGAIFTSSTISGGSLNINGNAIITSAGYLTAYGATITGTIYASAGSFAGSVTATSGQIGGFDIGATYLQNPAGTIRFNSNTATATVAGLTSSGSISAAGITNSGTLSMGGNNINNAGTVTCGSVNSSGVSTFSNIVNHESTTNLQAQTNYTGISSGSGNPMVSVVSGGRIAYTTSSERFKQDITYLADDGTWLDKVAALRPITFRTNVDYAMDDEPNDLQIGFLAEDLADMENEMGYAVIKDPLGDPFNISYDKLVVHLTQAIKELKAKVDVLEGN